jgi:DNA-binding transcriptional MerR regulator
MKYTWGQIAEMTGLDIPVTTLQSYRDRYIQFIQHTGKGRRRLYDMQAVDVLQTVAKMAGEGIATNYIREELQARYSPIVEMNPVTIPDPYMMMLESMRAEITEQKELIQSLNQKIDELLTTQRHQPDKVSWWDRWRNKKSP